MFGLCVEHGDQKNEILKWSKEVKFVEFLELNQKTAPLAKIFKNTSYTFFSLPLFEKIYRYSPSYPIYEIFDHQSLIFTNSRIF